MSEAGLDKLAEAVLSRPSSPALDALGASTAGRATEIAAQFFDPGIRASDIAAQFFESPANRASEIAARYFDTSGIRATEIAAQFFESPLPSTTAASVPAFNFLSDRGEGTRASALAATGVAKACDSFAKSILYDESGAFGGAFQLSGVDSSSAGVGSVKGFQSTWIDSLTGSSHAGSAWWDTYLPASDVLESVGAKALGWDSMRDHRPFDSILGIPSAGSAIDSLMSTFAVSSIASDLAHRLLEDLDEGLQPIAESLLEPAFSSRLPADEPELDDVGRISRFRLWWATLTFEQKLAFTQFVITSLEFVAMVTFGMFEIMTSAQPQQITNIYDNDVNVHHTTVNNTTIHQTTVVQAPIPEAP